jgi:hypothetical protein
MRSIIGLFVVITALTLAAVGFETNLSPSVAAQGIEQVQGSLSNQTESVAAAATDTLFFYSGGALEGVRKVAQNTPSTTTSTLFVNLAGASAAWFVPANDSDLLNVGFSGECRLINAALSATNQDWVELRAVLSRTPTIAGFPTFMQPYDITSPMAFCSANGYAMHHANFAARVSGGTAGATYRVQIQYKVTNNLPTANVGILTAWLDDWKLELLAFN